MPIDTRDGRYTRTAQALHWIIAALVVTQFALAYWSNGLPLGIHKLIVLARHKSVGMTILMLSVLRLLWRARRTPRSMCCCSRCRSAAG